MTLNERIAASTDIADLSDTRPGSAYAIVTVMTKDEPTPLTCNVVKLGSGRSVVEHIWPQPLLANHLCMCGKYTYASAIRQVDR